MFCSSRVGRSKQTATKENDSSEEMDVLQASSPVSDDTAQEGAEEEDISAGNVRAYRSVMCGIRECRTEPACILHQLHLALAVVSNSRYLCFCSLVCHVTYFLTLKGELELTRIGEPVI